MSGGALRAVQAALAGRKTYCKFLSATDTGATAGHQAGILIAKQAFPILFDRPGEKGANKEKRVKIKWQDDFETDSRFIYYGQKTRNEYRVTHFGRGFPFLRPEYTGALFVLVMDEAEYYRGFVLNDEDGITEFLDAFGLGPAETNRLVDIHPSRPEDRERAEIDRFIASLRPGEDFPPSEDLAAAARSIEDAARDHREWIRTDPDRKLLGWTDVEYRLFRALEETRYGERIKRGFSTVEAFILAANQALNRRKSRAGKSLEHHLAAIFEGNGLRYETQAVTEGAKRPDFLFPSRREYHDLRFPVDRIVSLAAKTTCKDRWRQILNEADRLKGRPKYLCTLQQGISAAQMDEMQAEGVVLVVPKPYIPAFPLDRRDRIWTIKRFVSYVREKETGKR